MNDRLYRIAETLLQNLLDSNSIHEDIALIGALLQDERDLALEEATLLHDSLRAGPDQFSGIIEYRDAIRALKSEALKKKCT